MILIEWALNQLIILLSRGNVEFKYPQQEIVTQNASILTAIIQFCYLIDCDRLFMFQYPPRWSQSSQTFAAKTNNAVQKNPSCRAGSMQLTFGLLASWSQKNGHRKTWGRNWVQVGCCREKHPNLFKLIPIVFKDHPGVNWYIHGSESVYRSDHKLGLEKKYSLHSISWPHLSLRSADTAGRIIDGNSTFQARKMRIDVRRLKENWSPSRRHLPPCSWHVLNVLLCDIYLIYHAFDTLVYVKIRLEASCRFQISAKMEHVWIQS